MLHDLQLALLRAVALQGRCIPYHGNFLCCACHLISTHSLLCVEEVLLLLLNVITLWFIEREQLRCMQGEGGSASADEYLEGMKQQGRYQRDVWF